MLSCVRVRSTVSLVHASSLGCLAPHSVSCLTNLEPRCSRPNQRSESLQILHFNDVYEVEPRTREPVGGVARFIGKLKTYPEACVLFSGDSLAPSLMSTVTKGEHMVCMPVTYTPLHVTVCRSFERLYARGLYKIRVAWLWQSWFEAHSAHSMYAVFVFFCTSSQIKATAIFVQQKHSRLCHLETFHLSVRYMCVSGFLE